MPHIPVWFGALLITVLLVLGAIVVWMGWTRAKARSLAQQQTPPPPAGPPLNLPLQVAAPAAVPPGTNLPQTPQSRPGPSVGGLISVFLIGTVFFLAILYAFYANWPAIKSDDNLLFHAFEVVGFIAIVITILLVAVWQNAKNDGLLRFVARNQGIVIDNGDGNPKKLLANLPKGWEVEGLRVVRGNSFSLNPFKVILRKQGIFWKGFPAQTHPVTFVHERINPDLNGSTDAANWMIRDKVATTADFFLFDKPHYVYIQGVEFKGGLRANILIQYMSRTVDYGISVYDRGGDVYPIVNAQIEAANNQQCSTITFEKFMKTKKSNPNDPFCSAILAQAGLLTPQLAGQEIYSLYVYRFDGADKTTRNLMQAVQQAQIELEAATLQAQAKVADVTFLSDELKKKFPDASSDTILKVVGQLGTIDRLSGSGIKAIGSGALIGINDDDTPTGGKKKATRQGGGKKRQ